MAALPDDWSWGLAQAMLDAAVSCGATCDRSFVSPVVSPEGLPPGCTCQLVAVVTEGWAPSGDPHGCGADRVASVRLVLDLCVPAAGEREVPDAVKWNTAARSAAATRWAMMRGLHRAWRAGEFCGGALQGWPAGTTGGCCAAVTPDSWRATRHDVGATRWETTWTWKDPT